MKKKNPIRTITSDSDSGATNVMLISVIFIVNQIIAEAHISSIISNEWTINPDYQLLVVCVVSKIEGPQ